MRPTKDSNMFMGDCKISPHNPACRCFNHVFGEYKGMPACWCVVFSK